MTRWLQTLDTMFTSAAPKDVSPLTGQPIHSRHMARKNQWENEAGNSPNCNNRLEMKRFSGDVDLRPQLDTTNLAWSINTRLDSAHDLLLSSSSNHDLRLTAAWLGTVKMIRNLRLGLRNLTILRYSGS